MKPSHEKYLGRSKVISLKLTAKERAKKKNRIYLFLTLLSNKPMTEHIAKKCRIPKKIKLSLSKKNVTVVISKQIISKIIKRFKNLALKKLPERFKSLEDIPEIIIKLAPTDCAKNNGKPCVIKSNAIKLK